MENKPICTGDCFNCQLDDCHPARGVLAKSGYITGRKGQRPNNLVDGQIEKNAPKRTRYNISNHRFMAWKKQH